MPVTGRFRDGSDGDGSRSRPIQLEPAMPIRRLATPAAYSPEQIEVLVGAHASACAALGVEQADTIHAEAVALKILERAAQGECDGDRLCAYAVHALRTRGS